MTGLERIRAAVAFEPSDRPAVSPQLFAYTGLRNGVPVDQYVSDGETQAACQLTEWENLGYDTVFAFMGLGVEAEAMGAQFTYHSDRYPDLSTPLPVSTNGSHDYVAQLPDPLVHGRLPELLRCAQILRERTADRAAVVGVVAGPLAIVTQLLGATGALNCAIDAPDSFARLLNLAAEATARVGEALLDCGVHVPLIFEPAGSPEFIPPQFFREHDVPLLTEICRRFRARGAEAVWLHIAGDVRPILPYYPHIGIDICNFDYTVAAGDAIAALPGTCLDGNIKPFAFVSDTPEQIGAEATALLDAFAVRGGYVLSSGCEIPPESNPAAVARLVQTAREYDRR